MYLTNVYCYCPSLTIIELLPLLVSCLVERRESLQLWVGCVSDVRGVFGGSADATRVCTYPSALAGVLLETQLAFRVESFTTDGFALGWATKNDTLALYLKCTCTSFLIL